MKLLIEHKITKTKVSGAGNDRREPIITNKWQITFNFKMTKLVNKKGDQAVLPQKVQQQSDTKQPQCQGILLNTW